MISKSLLIRVSLILTILRYQWGTFYGIRHAWEDSKNVFGSSVGAIETRPQHFLFYRVNLLKRKHEKWTISSNFDKTGQIWKILNLGSPNHQIKCLKVINWSIVAIGAILKIAILALFGQFGPFPNVLISQNWNAILLLDIKFDGCESPVLKFFTLDFIWQNSYKLSFFWAFYLVTLLYKIENAGDEFLWYLQMIQTHF